MTTLTDGKLLSVEVMFRYSDYVCLDLQGQLTHRGKFASFLVQSDTVCILAVNSENVRVLRLERVAPWDIVAEILRAQVYVGAIGCWSFGRLLSV